ncbi:MAG: transcriptional regulator [Acidocella sp. 20-57-95]|nr:MAG: transcriptional regulator [Acidocella sp. 20-57-95]HQT63729.1 metalloregulator ArsR/SmtB family transcription factor [Acidocella sp.]HQU05439.1 metalloregulator ArsR/SmtB family transcription factor [Acidocella sp.]
MTMLHKSKEAAIAATEKLKIFAQPQRLMILSVLLSGEFTVTEIDEATAIGQPALSQQLAALRRADVVDTRRDGKQIFYRLANEMVGACVQHIEGLFGETPTLPVTPVTAKAPAPAPAENAALPGAAAFAKVF